MSGIGTGAGLEFLPPEEKYQLEGLLYLDGNIIKAADTILIVRQRIDDHYVIEYRVAPNALISIDYHYDSSQPVNDTGRRCVRTCKRISFSHIQRLICEKMPPSGHEEAMKKLKACVDELNEKNGMKLKGVPT